MERLWLSIVFVFFCPLEDRRPRCVWNVCISLLYAIIIVRAVLPYISTVLWDSELTLKITRCQIHWINHSSITVGLDMQAVTLQGEINPWTGFGKLPQERPAAGSKLMADAHCSLLAWRTIHLLGDKWASWDGCATTCPTDSHCSKKGTNQVCRGK